MTNKTIITISLALFVLVGCANELRKRDLCEEHSEWRDNNGADSCSYYSNEESCNKILGKFEIKSRVHKGAYEKDVFNGGQSSRWLIIKEKSIEYYDPSGEIADKGTCNCEKGKLNIKWEKGDNLPERATIYFNSPDFVELRYYDYPFSMGDIQYDKSKRKNNPTKIIGTIK